jgi:hypothetical protein
MSKPYVLTMRFCIFLKCSEKPDFFSRFILMQK